MSTTAEKLRDMLAEPELEQRREIRPIRLYEAAADLNEVVGKIIDHDGELTAELEAELHRAEGTFLQKAEKVWLKLRELKASKAIAEVEIETLQENVRSFDGAIKRLESYLMGQMDATGQTKVRAPRAHFWIHPSNESCRWNGDTPEAIPDPFRRTKIVHTLNVDAVKEARGRGEMLPKEIVFEKGRHLRGK